jgi:hypothetical protein
LIVKQYTDFPSCFPLLIFIRQGNLYDVHSPQRWQESKVQAPVPTESLSSIPDFTGVGIVHKDDSTWLCVP